MQQSPVSSARRGSLANSSNSDLSDYSNKKYSLKRLASTLSIMDPVDTVSQGALMTLQQLKNLPDVYKQPASWKTNSHCQICKEEYKLISNREHHCRKCFKSVCKDCGCYMKFLDKKRDKKYRTCISCETLSLNRDLFDSYESLKQAVHSEIEVVKLRIEGQDHDVHQVETQLALLEEELQLSRQKHAVKKSKMNVEIESLTEKLKNKIVRERELNSYIRNAEISLTEVSGRIEGTRDELQIKQESNKIREMELKEKENKLRVMEKDVEEDAKSLKWKQTVRVSKRQGQKKRQMKEEPSPEAKLIKSKHKITLQEIKESVCESNGTNSFEEEAGLKSMFKSDLGKDRTMLMSDSDDWGNMSVEPK